MRKSKKGRGSGPANNSKKKSSKSARAAEQIPLPLSAVISSPVPEPDPELTEILATFKEFDSDFDGIETQDLLWHQMQLACLSQEGFEEPIEAVRLRFFFYDRLRATLPAVHRLSEILQQGVSVHLVKQ